MDKSLLELLEKERLTLDIITTSIKCIDIWSKRMKNQECDSETYEYHLDMHKKVVDSSNQTLVEVRKQIKGYFEFIQSSFVDFE